MASPVPQLTSSPVHSWGTTGGIWKPSPLILSVMGKAEKPGGTEQNLNSRRSSDQSDTISSSFQGARGYLGFKLQHFLGEKHFMDKPSMKWTYTSNGNKRRGQTCVILGFRVACPWPMSNGWGYQHVQTSVKDKHFKPDLKYKDPTPSGKQTLLCENHPWFQTLPGTGSAGAQKALTWEPTQGPSTQRTSGRWDCMQWVYVFLWKYFSPSSLCISL